MDTIRLTVQESIPPFSPAYNENSLGGGGNIFPAKRKKKPTGEGNKANQLPLLRTSSKTGDKFSHHKKLYIKGNTY